MVLVLFWRSKEDSYFRGTHRLFQRPHILARFGFRLLETIDRRPGPTGSVSSMSSEDFRSGNSAVTVGVRHLEPNILNF